MLVIGLTGGIGSGKSAAARILQGLGAEVIDADKVGHEAYAQGTEGWREVVRAFGDGILAESGDVDRKKLGAVVFSDAQALKRLNAILHPRMYTMMKDRLDILREQGSSVAVVEAALLIEANWARLADEIWVVVSPADMVLQRLRRRSGANEESIRARIQSQMPDDKRVSYADVVIENSGTLAELEEHVKASWRLRASRYQENDKGQ